MKNSVLILLVSLVTWFQPEEKLTETGNWKLIKNKDGIKAFTREVKESDVKQVRVTATIKTTLTALVAIVRDVGSHTKWIYRCKKATVLKRNNNTDTYYYNETEAPWPVADRDIITHAVIKQNKETKIVTITSTGVPNYIPEKKDIVRIKKLNAKWIFVPKPDGTIDVTSLLLIDLGGDLPSWLVNMAIADGPFETVYNMRKEVIKSKYQNIVYEFIEEL